MFTRAKAALVALVLVATALVGVTPASAAVSYIEGTDPARVVFDPTAISKIELNHPAGSPWLTFDYLNSETYRPANIKITLAGKKAVTINNVGLRLKGQASRYDPKFPMKVKFDAFVKGQNFLGLKRMTLNNMVQDPSFVHEATAYKLYRAAGVPAPRTGYSKVSVEGFYMGLYLNIESIDKVFAKRWYKSTGHIYSGPYNCDVIPNNTCYTASTGDAVRTDLNNAGDASLLHGAAWWTAINNVADMNRVIRLMATDIFMSNWDGYSDAVQNNHFAHFDQDSKLTIIPWGLDQTFTTDPNANLTWDASGPIFRGWSDHRSTLLDHCIEYTPCHSQLIKEGARISKLATSIKLVDFKTKVGAVINSIIANDGDIHGNSVQNLVSAQSWIDQFIPNRQAVLAEFLTNTPALPVTLTREVTTRAGAPAKITLTNLWQSGVTVSYQWLKNTSEIEGATKAVYTPTNDDIDSDLSVRVTLSKAGTADTVQYSDAKVVLARAFKLSATPTISGTAAVGKTLKAVTGKWDSQTTFSYQWFRGTNEIFGQNNSSYRLNPEDRGSQISVRVTATKANYVSVTKSSQKTSRVR
jgi:hypothetical protein